LGKQLPMRSGMRTTRIALFADKGKNTHGTAFAVRALAHGKGRPAHFYPVKNFAVRFGKGNARHNTLPCVIRDARQRKGVDGRPRGDGVTPSLPCAPEHARER
jgi:hypothetical protein